jgi:preprotein translocase subunit SecY
MWEMFRKISKLPDLRRRIIFTISLLVVFRFLANVPMPGVNVEELKTFFDNNQFFGLMNMFTGGAMKNFSLAMMGVGPYITSSIIFQLLTMVVPSLENLSKEGESGKQKINYYTRILTVPLAIVQSYAMIFMLKNQGLVINSQGFDLLTMIISLTAGTMFVMWLGELISENGIGNGISLIITIGIIAAIPSEIIQTIYGKDLTDISQLFNLIIFGILAIVITAVIVWFNYSERQIPITYARRAKGNSSYGAVDTFLPIRITMAGVIPIIFAMSIMIFPGVASKFFAQARSQTLVHIANWTENIFNNHTFYAIAYFLIVIIFTFFYTSVIFHPNEVAENLQKRGGFIPGLRPGKETQDFLSTVISRTTLIGALFLGIIAVLPYVIPTLTDVSTMALGGTGILIVVSVILDTLRQIKSQILMRNYDNY